MIDPNRLQQIIQGGETFTVEFKGEERSSLSDHDLVEAVVCLANGQGGVLLVGVEDDGQVTGARPRHGLVSDPLRVQSLIQGRTVPALTTRVHLQDYQGQSLLIIEVPRAERPVGTAGGHFLRRAVGADGRPICLPFFHHEMVSREATLGLLDYSALPVAGATWDGLDLLEFYRLRQTIEDQQGDQTLLALSDLEIAKALGLVEADGEPRSPTVAGLLMVGKEKVLRRFLPTHEVAFQVLRQGRVEVNEFFRGPLVRVSDQIYERFRARLHEEEMMVGMQRIGIPEYAPGAFREAVHNALLHRDYARLGTVYVQWYEDRIEVSNPGGFVEGVRLDNLLVVRPKPRNPVLADAFKRIGLVERTGRGIDLIFDGQLRTGHRPPDYGRSDETGVTVVLAGGAADLAFARFVIEQGRAGKPLALDDLLILHALQEEKPVDRQHVASLIQRSSTEAMAQLERLMQFGWLEARGRGEKRQYLLAGPARSALGRGKVAAGTREVDPSRCEAILEQYVRAQGKITRAEAAEMCGLSPSQAYRLLRRLADKGVLKQIGSGRGAYYETTHGAGQ
jgi:ATP-dependent DNA helicase RecG